MIDYNGLQFYIFIICMRIPQFFEGVFHSQTSQELLLGCGNEHATNGTLFESCVWHRTEFSSI